MQNISTAFTEMFWSFAICAFFCEFGEWVTNKFNCFDDEIYRCDWYLLPLNTQKLHLILMQNTQQPALIEGYANIWCLRDTFKKVHFIRRFVFKLIHFRFFFALDCQQRIFLLHDTASNQRIV